MASTVVRRIARPVSQLISRPNCALKCTSAQSHFRCLAGTMHRPILSPAKVELIPSRCIQSTGDKELLDFLGEEIVAETKQGKLDKLPSRIGDFDIKLDQAEVTLTKKHNDESVTVTLNVNHSVDSDPEAEDLTEAQGSEQLKARPSFNVDLKRGNRTVSFTCSYTDGGVVEQQGEQYNDNFSIDEVVMFEGEHHEKNFSVSGEILDGFWLQVGQLAQESPTMGMPMEMDETRQILAQFCSETGEVAGAPLNLPATISKDKLQLVCNALLEKEEEPVPYSFFVGDLEVTSSLQETLERLTVDSEKVLNIVYQPQAVFRVKAVTRCTSSIPGHAEAVIAARFSPDGRRLASGSGDKTVRFWDVSTETPQHTCSGHRHWVLCIAWSPDGRQLASGCKAGEVRLWDPATGQQRGKPLTGHKQWITAVCWQPLHSTEWGRCRLLASSSKDGDVRLWDGDLQSSLRVLTSHTQSVTALRWGGAGLIYSGSQDRTVKVWRAEDGVMVRALLGHGHWVNTLALSTDYVMRVGAYDPARGDVGHLADTATDEERLTAARSRYSAVLEASGGEERLVSGSDDFTMFLWSPARGNKPIARMTGHQALINDVRFSPDSRLIASASFDKSIRIWEGKTGKFVAALRGHVQAVYMVAWSADSRLLVSGSADSTLKVWSMKTRKLQLDLPGHADEVFAVDWSPDGERVVSGGKDKLLRIWRR